MDSFAMKRASIHINKTCNLKCRLCAAFQPYHKPCTYPVEYLRESLKRYFKIVTFVEDFTIAGGEPLLHPNLSDIILCFQNYSRQFGRLQIITNGSIIPSSNVLGAISVFGNQFFILIDNYGEDCSVKTEELDHLLTNYNICHTVRNYTKEDPHCGGWVDFGDLTQKRHTNQGDIEMLFSKCAYPHALKFCFSILEGKMCPCPPYHRCRELGVIDDYNEYVDLFDDALTIEEQRTKIQNIYNKKSLSACAYCNGLCDDSPRFVPAQQLTTEELACIRAGARSYAEVVQRLGR